MPIVRKYLYFAAAAIAFIASSPQASATAYQVIHTFTGGTDGAFPQAGLTADAAGNLYGTAAQFPDSASFANMPAPALRGSLPVRRCSKTCGIAFTLLRSGNVQTLHVFKGGKDGAQPDSPLLIYNGSFYGTTSEGGRFRCDHSTCGTVYKIGGGARSRESILYRFCGVPHCTNGNEPTGGVIADNAGNLYGETVFGGVPDCPYGEPGCGTVFKLAPDGSESVLYAFCPQQPCNDGRDPDHGLVADSAENLFGVTTAGGTYNEGTVFKLTPQGTETVLHSFTGGADGGLPIGPLTQDSAGNLYGVTQDGGDFGCDSYGCGVVFRMRPGGTEKVLYGFKGGADAEFPQAGVTIDSDGTIYGTTAGGGGNTACGLPYGCGTVFKLTADGTFTILHAFCSERKCRDGYYPLGVLLSQGNDLYGTTFQGGSSNPFCRPYGCGVVFKLAKN